MTTPKTYYGITDGDWHAIRLRGAGDSRSMFTALCSDKLIPVSVVTYLGGDLCPECRERLTREIVEEE